MITAMRVIDKYEHVRNMILADGESKHVLDTIVYMRCLQTVIFIILKL